MGRWTYYSPSLIGTVLAGLMFATYREFMPAWPAWQYWLMAVSACVGGGDWRARC